mmetsp:Transcript_2785/g.6992  ORF Transcript_2785/g.6992 Transcript_2785/m.6992 type:complete len:120 (-) Transcript_2785:262-621(-)
MPVGAERQDEAAQDRNGAAIINSSTGNACELLMHNVRRDSPIRTSWYYEACDKEACLEAGVQCTLRRCGITGARIIDRRGHPCDMHNVLSTTSGARMTRMYGEKSRFYHPRSFDEAIEH